MHTADGGVLVEEGAQGQAAYVYLNGREPVSGEISDSDEILPGIVIDYRKNGSIAGVELLRSRYLERAETRDVSFTRSSSEVSELPETAEPAPEKERHSFLGTDMAVLYLHTARKDDIVELRPTEDERVLAGMCKAGKLCCLLFLHPENTLTA